MDGGKRQWRTAVSEVLRQGPVDESAASEMLDAEFARRELPLIEDHREILSSLLPRIDARHNPVRALKAAEALLDLALGLSPRCLVRRGRWMARPWGRTLRGPSWTIDGIHASEHYAEIIERVAADSSRADRVGDDIEFPAWLALDSTVEGQPVAARVGRETLGYLKPRDAARVRTDVERLARYGRVVWGDGRLRPSRHGYRLSIRVGHLGVTNWDVMLRAAMIWFAPVALFGAGAVLSHGTAHDVWAALAVVATVAFLGLVAYSAAMAWIFRKVIRAVDRAERRRR